LFVLILQNVAYTLHWALMLATMALFNTSISKVLSLFVGRKLHAKSCASYFFSIL